MKIGWFFDCGQPLLEISVHSFLIWMGRIHVAHELTEAGSAYLVTANVQRIEFNNCQL